MNKNELVDQVAERAAGARRRRRRDRGRRWRRSSGKPAAGGEVAITGFGKFSVSDRGARHGRHPQTGEPIDVPADPARLLGRRQLEQAVPRA